MTTIQFILGYLVIMNFAAWLLFGIDKHKAENHEFRIPEAVLFMPLILALQIAFLALFCTHFNVSIR